MSRPDDIPAGRFASLNVVEALSTARDVPVDALELAVRAPARLAEPVLRAAEAAAGGAGLSERDRNLLFWGAHALGAARETRLHRPLLRLLRRPADDVAELLGEAMGATLPRIVASTFDGDPSAIEEALLDRDGDELVRFDLFCAYAFLTAAGRVERARAEATLARFDDERLARAGDGAWSGWALAIALAPCPSLAGRIAAARADARLIEEEGEEDALAATLAEAAARPDELGRFEPFDVGEVEDVIAELDRALGDAEEGPPPEPVRNPHRAVGRNDPCPCGSGLKHKKCCLAAGADEA